jgi:uncharacterized DUF497 family protein
VALTKFTWDPGKAASNLDKHGISFGRAATVFDDVQARYEADLHHGERRELVIGMSADSQVLLVVFIEFDAQNVIRIISARKATKREKRAYEQGD